MTDVIRLKAVIERSGLKKTFLAEQLGITYQCYLNKENGKSEFLASQIVKLQDLLKLTDKETNEIFLCKK